MRRAEGWDWDVSTSEPAGFAAQGLGVPRGGCCGGTHALGVSGQQAEQQQMHEGAQRGRSLLPPPGSPESACRKLSKS